MIAAITQHIYRREKKQWEEKRAGRKEQEKNDDFEWIYVDSAGTSQ